MTAQVLAFAHSGIAMAHVASDSGQRFDQSLLMLKQPYLARQTFSVDTGTAQSSTESLSPINTKLLHIQVQPGKRVHYEISPPGREGGPVAADTSSPVIDGKTTIHFGQGWTVSFLEAS